MIIVRLSGGLGNQLFQYATGRALAIRNQVQLVVDDRVFLADTFRRFCLPVFNAEYVLASELPAAEDLLPPSRKRWVQFLYWRITRGRSLRFVRERTLLFDPAIPKIGPNVYLHGYWQSEQYFCDLESVIRNELTFRVSPSNENLRWLTDIGSATSVSVHVRRGDYVADAKASRIHGTCSLDYYERAAEEIAGRLKMSPTFYVFSDDPEWVQKNLRLRFNVRYINHNDDAHNYEDLRLMSACQHHIVANSSFSWWGAWLGTHPNKTIIAPRVWFNDPSRNDSSLVPTDWIRL